MSLTANEIFICLVGSVNLVLKFQRTLPHSPLSQNQLISVWRKGSLKDYFSYDTGKSSLYMSYRCSQLSIEIPGDVPFPHDGSHKITQFSMKIEKIRRYGEDVHYVSMSQSPSLSLCVSLSLSVSWSLVYVCLCVCVCLCLSVSECVSVFCVGMHIIYVDIHAHTHTCVCVCVFVCVFVFVCVCVCVGVGVGVCACI